MTTCIHGDCLEVMKDLPDKSVDLFICDLPYGCLAGGAGKEKKKRTTGIIVEGGCQWDIKIDLDAFWIQVKRLCKNDKTPVLMFCNTRFGVDLINSNPEWFRYDIVWEKPQGVNFLCANKQPMRSHEMIYVFAKKCCIYNRIDMPVEGKGAYFKKNKACYSTVYNFGNDEGISKKDSNKRCPTSVIHFPSIRSGPHPTCKSVDLYKWLIERYSNENDMILDPTAGSFNSGRACQELNRQYIGIEKDKEFYEKNNIN
jgi:site-specific DNA-methyltransferase (adenine-specific)